MELVQIWLNPALRSHSLPCLFCSSSTRYPAAVCPYVLALEITVANQITFHMPCVCPVRSSNSYNSFCPSFMTRRPLLLMKLAFYCTENACLSSFQYMF